MTQANKKPKSAAQPNIRLRKARERMGLSYDEVADQLNIPDPRTVGRWERGEHRPRGRYRRLLSDLYKQSIEDLGLLEPDQETPPIALAPSEDDPEVPDQAEVNPYKTTIKRSFTSFIGRAEAIAGVRELLQRPEARLVTILGPGGVGKTRLANEVAQQCHDQFADNICMVSFTAIREAALVLPTIARELHIRENGTLTLAAGLQRLFTQKQPFLLILDNFEHILHASDIIEQLLIDCPSLKVLVTSRAVLAISGEWEFPLDPFDLPGPDATDDELLACNAIELFVQRAKARRNTFQATPENLPLIYKICAILDGLPLAIELAAARVKLFSLPDLLEEVSENSLHLRIPKSAEGPATSFQPETLSDTIQWSYDLLNEPRRWLFRQIAVFPGGCTLAAAKKIWSHAPFAGEDALSLLTSLLDHNMVRPVALDQAHAFFLMLETIRAYGLQQLRLENELENAQRVHALYYLELLRQAEPFLKGPKQGAYLTMLDRERLNLSTALTWLLENGESEQALAFCEVFGHFCGLRGYWTEEAHWLKEVLNLSSTKPASLLRGRVLRRAGHLAYRTRDLPLARRLFEESIAISLEQNDQFNLAGALMGLARVHAREHNLAPVQQLFEASVEAARESSDAWSLANALEALGSFVFSQGKNHEASLLLRESLDLARQIEDAESVARLLNTVVSIELALDHVEQAEKLAREGSEYASVLGNKPLIALALNGLADVAMAQKAFTRAAELYQQRLQFAGELGDKATIALMELKLGEIALAEKYFERAESLAQQSLNYFQEHGDKPNINHAIALLDKIHRRQEEK